MDWHYTQNDETVGPVNEEQIRDLIAAGTLTAESMVWNSTFTDWMPLANTELAKLLSGSSPTPEAGSDLCSICNKAFPADQLVEIGGQRSCAICKPMALKRFQENSASHANLDYAGFWIRVVSTIIDGIVITPILLLLFFLFGVSIMGNAGNSPGAFMATRLLVQFLQYAVGFLYTTILIWKYGGTLGLLVMGLRVVNPDGTKISYLKSVGRYFAYMLNGFTLFIGFIMVAFDKEKRALHDVICNTRVVYK